MSEFRLTEEDLRRAWDGQDDQAIYEADITIGSRDIANTHDSNATLRERESVKAFYELVNKKKSQLFRIKKSQSGSKTIWQPPEGRIYMDEETLEWLGDLPFTMNNDAIPLFEDPVTNTDYQLHPCYPRLPIGKKVQNSNLNLQHLYYGDYHNDIDLKVYGQDVYAIPLGRLFIIKNTKSNEHGEFPRLSKWTGYEVFLDLGFQIWIAFNRNSLAEQHYGWYPVTCRLFSQATNILHGESSDPNIADGSVISTEPDIKMGSIGMIGETNFEDAMQVLIKSSITREWPMVDEITEADAKERLDLGELIETPYHALDMYMPLVGL